MQQITGGSAGEQHRIATLAKDGASRNQIQADAGKSGQQNADGDRGITGYSKAATVVQAGWLPQSVS
jgi:hypothetical protein